MRVKELWGWGGSRERAGRGCLSGRWYLGAELRVVLRYVTGRGPAGMSHVTAEGGGHSTHWPGSGEDSRGVRHRRVTRGKVFECLNVPAGMSHVTALTGRAVKTAVTASRGERPREQVC